MKGDDHKDRKLKYYKKTVQLLTIALEVFFLFFVAAIIFLFIATDDAARFEAENQQLLTTQQNLENQLAQQLVGSDPISSLDDGVLSRSFLVDGEPVIISVPLNTTFEQIRQGFQRREFIDLVAIPLHTKYAQTCYDFSVYCGESDIDDLRDYYAGELTSLQSSGPNYLVLPLGATQKTVMDFRDYVDPSGFNEEISELRQRYTDDEKFIEALWKVTSSITTYSREIQETPRYPLETLLLGGGDCEDSAILFASMLNSIDHGWEVSFLYTDLFHPTRPLEFNHVLVHIDTGSEEFFVETTSKEVMNPYSEVTGEFISI